MSSYLIEGRTFVQSKLYLGKIRQCLVLLKDFDLREAKSLLSLITCLGDKLPQLLAILLVETNIDFKPIVPHSTEELVKLFSESKDLDLNLLKTIVTDFFVLNPLMNELFGR